MMYQYCREHNIPHANLGKLLVATSPDQVTIAHHIVSVHLQQSASRVELAHACANDACILLVEKRCVQQANA